MSYITIIIRYSGTSIIQGIQANRPSKITEHNSVTTTNILRIMYRGNKVRSC